MPKIHRVHPRSITQQVAQRTRSVYASAYIAGQRSRDAEVERLTRELAEAKAVTMSDDVAQLLNYQNGLELQPEAGERGWAVYTGCDGEDPRLVGFFPRKEDAELFTNAPDPDDEDGEVYPLDGNNSIELALLTEFGIVTANSYEITTHEQLESRITAALARGGK